MTISYNKTCPWTAQCWIIKLKQLKRRHNFAKNLGGLSAVFKWW
jgi:hypothetical protein